MQEPDANLAQQTTVTDNAALRFMLSFNKRGSYVAAWFAKVLQVITRPLPNVLKRPLTSWAQNLQVLATLMVDPLYARKLLEIKVILLSAFEVVVLSAVFGFWDGKLFKGPLFFGILLCLLAILIVILFIFLVSFFAASADVYFAQQDEFQKALDNQAGAVTLRTLAVLLPILLVLYFVFNSWHDALLHLSVLVFVGLVTYLGKLTQLRWHELTQLHSDSQAGTVY
jgi:hypothetical protein